MKTYTERQVVLRERAAFEAAVRFHTMQDESSIRMALALRYPLPTITRVRRVKDPVGIQVWEVRAGELGFTSGRSPNECFHTLESEKYLVKGTVWEPTLARIKLWADLLANPTETVEDCG